MRPELEDILTNNFKTGMIEYMLKHPELINDLIQLALSNEKGLSWRAAWLLYDCMEQNDIRIKPHLKKIIKLIPSKDDGHQRELLKILFKMDLKGQLEGEVFDCCLKLWEDITKKPSIRYYAFHMLIKISDKHPDLKNEILFITQDHYTETLSPGVKKGILKLVSKLNQSSKSKSLYK